MSRGRPLTKREILLRARKLIESGRERYICLAAEAVVSKYLGHPQTSLDNQVKTRAAKDSVRGFINGLLGWPRVNTLERWIADQGYVRHDEVWANEYEVDFRAVRLRWIDWMLTQPEFQS